MQSALLSAENVRRTSTAANAGTYEIAMATASKTKAVGVAGASKTASVSLAGGASSSTVTQTQTTTKANLELDYLTNNEIAEKNWKQTDTTARNLFTTNTVLAEYNYEIAVIGLDTTQQTQLGQD